MEKFRSDEPSDGFIMQLLKGILGSLLQTIIAFAVGTAGGAVVCWYLGFPYILALFGGFLVLALWLALTTDSIFD